MRNPKTRKALAVATVSALLVISATSASAEDPSGGTETSPFGAALSPMDLDDYRGGEHPCNEGCDLGNMVATLSENKVVQESTGANLIDNAFNNSAILGNIIQNTGSGVIIQTSVSVNINAVAPAP